MADDELVDIVDDYNREIGSARLTECLAKGLLHRSVAVLVFRSSGRVLLQRRSTKDAWHPGLWTLSSTGHVRKGEGYETAASRELYEELGLEGTLARIGELQLPPFVDRGLSEREWVGVFQCTSDDECTLDTKEIEEVREFGFEDLRSMFGSESMTPDARIILEKFFLS